MSNIHFPSLQQMDPQEITGVTLTVADLIQAGMLK